jgi:hypothetical protein
MRFRRPHPDPDDSSHDPNQLQPPGSLTDPSGTPGVERSHTEREPERERPRPGSGSDSETEGVGPP